MRRKRGDAITGWAEADTSRVEIGRLDQSGYGRNLEEKLHGEKDAEALEYPKKLCLICSGSTAEVQ